MSEDASKPLAAEEAFEALGDETRVAILRAFDPPVAEPKSFSELRERVGAPDSGRFNYHLGKLVGRFVRKTEGGYELTTTGVRVYGAILSGAYTGSESFDPLPLVDDRDVCPLCDGGLELRYVDDRLSVECSECGEWRSTTAVPPSAIDGRDRGSLPEVLSHNLRTTVDAAVSGFCPICSGPTAGAFERREAGDGDGADEPEVMVVYECERCGSPLTSTVGATLLGHPAVVSFYHDHGVNVRSEPVWRLSLVHPEAAAVVREDPTRVRVSAERDGERLDVTLDADLNVVETERNGA